MGWRRSRLPRSRQDVMGTRGQSAVMPGHLGFPKQQEPQIPALAEVVTGPRNVVSFWRTVHSWMVSTTMATHCSIRFSHGIRFGVTEKNAILSTTWLRPELLSSSESETWLCCSGWMVGASNCSCMGVSYRWLWVPAAVHIHQTSQSNCWDANINH